MLDLKMVFIKYFYIILKQVSMNINSCFLYIVLIEHPWGFVFFVVTKTERGKLLKFLFKFKEFVRTEIPETKTHYILESLKYLNEIIQLKIQREKKTVKWKLSKSYILLVM